MMDTSRGEGKTALITGASSGIGAELCELIAADGYSLIVCARRQPELQRLAIDLRTRFGSRVDVIAWDLARPGAGADLWQELQRRGTIQVDLLVNNAGVGMYGPFAECDSDDCQRMLQLNINAAVELARCTLPGMRQRKSGAILNVASLVAYQPGGPGMAAYYASKAFVLSWSKALARELSGSGVRVTALCPGPTRTEFEQRAAPGQRILRWLPRMSARAVAAAGYRGLRRGAMSVVPGWLNKLLALGGELPPRRIGLEINRILLRG